jgi:CRISPR system Cascade subunit CasC
MFIELHMIQNFVPSNLNRDDTGSPKDCIFGGQRRARISSQCLKRSIRMHDLFATTTKVPTSKRTQYLAAELARDLVSAHGKAEEDAMAVAVDLMGEYTSPNKKKPEQSAVLIFISEDEVTEIANHLAARWDEAMNEKLRPGVLKEIVKEMVKQYQNRVAAPDIALFGRMLADEPKLNLEAACQVAHAISTHRVNMEMDYFTAVDDVREEQEETGAGHINTLGFNSSCFYRYARIDWDQLRKNLNGDTDLARRTVEGFLRASIAAVPSGKQNSTAPLNPPSFLLAVVRTDGMGWNLANAFEKPVSASHSSSLVEGSIAALDRYWGKLEAMYGSDTLKKVSSLNLDGEALTHLNGERAAANLNAWIDAVMNALSASPEKGGSEL